MTRGRRAEGGLTLIELVVAVAIIGIVVALAVPGFEAWQDNQRLKGATRSVANAFSFARSEAIRTGDVHVVFLQNDALGNPLLDVSGNPVPILVLDDGAPGSANQNCRIDAGERIRTVAAETGVAWGISAAPAPAPSDAGGGLMASGATFTDPGGNTATWLLFRPEGFPLAFDAACGTGPVGSGAGAAYLTNGRRDYAVVVTPLGGFRVHAWDIAAAAWSS